MSIKDLLPGRAPASGEPALLAALQTAQSELVRIEGEAAAMVGAARGEVTRAQGALDTFRRAVVEKHARVWRAHARTLRQRAEETDELATSVVKVHVIGGQGPRVEPQLVFVRTQLLEQADQSDTRAGHLEGCLSAGDALNGADLQLLVSQLEDLPADVPEPVAV